MQEKYKEKAGEHEVLKATGRGELEDRGKGGKCPKCPGGHRLKGIGAQGSERVTGALA